MRIYAFTIGFYDSELQKTVHDEGFVAAESFSDASKKVIDVCTNEESNLSYCYISAYEDMDCGVCFFENGMMNPREMMVEDCKE